jgi:(p)ppGpp synthase/HD superfamily hydrolase
MYHFNPVVQRIVDGVARMNSRMKSFEKLQVSNHETILKLLKSKDNQVLYVKLADRLHNMRTIEGHKEVSKQQKIAIQTLPFFVPIAQHLKLYDIGKALQQLASQVLNKL